jgi:uncharacterized protein YciI
VFAGGIVSAKGENYYFVFLNTNADAPRLEVEDLTPIQQKHMATMNRLANEGKLIASGPFDSGGGFFILVAKDTVELGSMLRTDTAIRMKRFIVEYYSFTFTRGKVCPLDGVNMVTYGFVRLAQSGKTIPWDEVDDTLSRAGKVLMSGSFGEGIGGVVIMKASRKDIETVMKAGDFFIRKKIIPSVKELWIAEGTFCETAE